MILLLGLFVLRMNMRTLFSPVATNTAMSDSIANEDTDIFEKLRHNEQRT